MILPLLLIALRGLAPWGPERITDLIEALGDPDIEVRGRAQETLRKILPKAEPELRERQNHRDPEVAARCKTLLEDFQMWRLAGRMDCDASWDCLAVHCRMPDRLKFADRLQVTRKGRKVGVVVVVQVQPWGCWVKPDDENPLQGYQRGDAVERFEYTGR